MQPLGRVSETFSVSGAPERTAYGHAPYASRRYTNVGAKAKPVRRVTRKRQTLCWQLWHGLLSGLVVLTLLYGGLLGGHINRWAGQTAVKLDEALAFAGFGISNVQISGIARVSRGDIIETLALDDAISIVSFDQHGAQQKLQSLPWVRTARVKRLLPSTLHIEIEEREPLAYWQYKGAHYVVDARGEVIIAAEPALFGSLPLIVGEGAPHHAGPLLAALMRHPRLATRAKALIRVADRRWTIALRSGPDILLPEVKVGKALRRFSELNEAYHLLDRPVSSIDLRLPGRVTLTPARLQPATDETPQIIGAAPAPERPAGDV